MIGGQSILVVDDDRFLLDNLKRLLAKNGYNALTAVNGTEALAAAAQHGIDLLILDVGLPGQDGLTVCRKLRAKWKFPIIMLTARSDAMDKVVGLEVGADDYLTKPFEPAELLARIRAQLRRATEYVVEETLASNIAVGNLVIDYSTRDAIVEGRKANLTNREFELLSYLANNLGRVIERESLFEKVWGFPADFNSNSLDVYIYRIRKKIESDPDNPRYLHTLRGYGYKLQSA